MKVFCWRKWFKSLVDKNKEQGIARALYKKANIIILDEVTSALDNITEKIPENILQDPNRTVIMVSHSTESIKECDIIHEIKNGKIKN